MRCSVNIANLGDFADPWVVAEVARLAEDCGWDGVFIWDVLIGYNTELVADVAATSVLLAAAALATTRIRLGTLVTAVPRRRPAQLAREIATLDRLSEGRMILGAGLGEPVGNEYGRVGAPTDLTVLAGMCDEGLEAITLLWSGEPVSFRGRYVTVDEVVMRPVPVQQPRVPVFIGGTWPRQGPARRAARWDGSVLHAGTAWEQPPDPAVIAQMRAFFQARRRESGRENQPFDLVAGGSTPGDPGKARDILGPLADAGATWWDERFPFDQLARADAVRARIEQGPPRIT